MTIFVGYWLINANTVVAAGMLVAHGETGWLARYAWSVALGCLACSLALTPPLGLDGLVLGHRDPLRRGLSLLHALRAAQAAGDAGRPGPARLAARLPAGGSAGARAGGRRVLALDLDTLGEVLAVGLGGLAAYWLVFAALFLEPSERRLAVDVVRGMFRTG